MLKNISIIGCGPRGVIALERVINQIINTNFKVTINVFDENEFGPGVHSNRTTDSLKLNTPCDLLTLNPSHLGYKSFLKKEILSFKDWLIECDLYQLDKIYYPRYFFGDYCKYIINEIVNSVKISSITVNFFQKKVTKLIESDCSSNQLIRTSDGCEFKSDFLILTTGHGCNKDYVLNNKFNSVLPAENVFINGMGLTAYDSINRLTLDKGGKFSYSDEKMVYTPSGKEPNIYLFSRGGLPLLSRPFDDLTFNKNNINPILIDSDIESTLNTNLFNDFYVAKESYTFNDYLNNKVAVSNTVSYKDYIINFLESDINESELGLKDSCFKYNNERLLYSREHFRKLYNYKNNKQSNIFFERISPIINKICIGPDLNSQKKLLTLIQQGVVKLCLGVNPKIENINSIYFATNKESNIVIRSKFIFEGRVVNEEWNSGIIYNYIKNHKSKLTTKNVAFNNNFNLYNIENNEVVSSKIFFNGVITEGSTYYNWYVPTFNDSYGAFEQLNKISELIINYGK
ncbi:FAD/NAD(P)-binding protein [Aliivibrio fischeri]|uniref:FAD/NAD(P)-binding protein n=1 Tax=Aliivibrio fischeri TaxID=668 RepID=UPI001F43315E|nr:FAD/NAD(P)-binding protein [Aliivibrio fischeri]MCE7534921.1 FAD/NAD(P)-binding protein [Aliivibrio fischeri]MCE7559363.1 FAD/NAD(P)-binding protein [Aliivibrio fischeri]